MKRRIVTEQEALNPLWVNPIWEEMLNEYLNTPSEILDWEDEEDEEEKEEVKKCIEK